MTPLRSAFLVSLAFLTGMGAARADEGSTGMAFLRLGVGSRSLAMGETGGALAGDPSLLHYNPATIASVSPAAITFMHRSWIQGTSVEHLAGASRFGSLSLGFSVYSVSVDDIEVRDVPGPPVATFAARNAAFGITAAYPWSERLSVGVTVKYLYEKILVEDAGGIGFDLGAAYRASAGLRLGASILNLGSMSELATQASALPRMLRAGAMVERELEGTPLSVAGAVDFLAPLGDGSSHLHVGGEATAYGAVSVRAGYQTGYEARGLTVGTGVRHGIVGVDYAFMPSKYDLGATHALSLTLLLR